MARDIPLDLRRAGVPKSCWGRKLEESGLGYITEWAKSVETQHAAKEAKCGIYVRASNANKAAELVELYARQAVVYGQLVRHLPLRQLFAEIKRGQIVARYEDDLTKPYAQNEIYDVFSVGVIAVPFVPARLEDSHLTAADMGYVYDYLMSHVYGGGVLIFGGTEPITARLQSKYEELFERTVFHNSEIVEAV